MSKLDEDEFRILRKLVKCWLLKEGQLLPQNELKRQIGQLAHKISEGVDDVRAVIIPILSEIYEEMIAEEQAVRQLGIGIPNEEVFNRR